MTYFVTGAAVALLGIALVACGPASTAIVDVSVVTTLPKEVGPGGFQKTIAADGIATGVFYKAKLSDCRSELEKAARTWAGQHGLAEGQHTFDQRSSTLRFTYPRPPQGVFSVTYILASDRNSASLHVSFGGASQEATLSAQDLESLGMSAFVDNLVMAAQCEAASS